MIEWIIFILITIIISETLFFKFAKRCDDYGEPRGLVAQKVQFLFFGVFITIFFFFVPFLFAYGCHYPLLVDFLIPNSEGICYGLNAFFLVYGSIAAIILFFWSNIKLFRIREERKERKENKQEGKKK